LTPQDQSGAVEIFARHGAAELGLQELLPTDVVTATGEDEPEQEEAGDEGDRGDESYPWETAQPCLPEAI
jgi:hypothetical protein